jgi:hypothetical protein
VATYDRHRIQEVHPPRHLAATGSEILDLLFLILVELFVIVIQVVVLFIVDIDIVDLTINLVIDVVVEIVVIIVEVVVKIVVFLVELVVELVFLLVVLDVLRLVEFLLVARVPGGERRSETIDPGRLWTDWVFQFRAH